MNLGANDFSENLEIWTFSWPSSNLFQGFDFSFKPWYEKRFAFRFLSSNTINTNQKCKSSFNHNNWHCHTAFSLYISYNSNSISKFKFKTWLKTIDGMNELNFCHSLKKLFFKIQIKKSLSMLQNL